MLVEHTLNMSKAVFPAKGGGYQQAFLGGSAQQFSVMQIIVSLPYLHNLLFFSGTVRAAGILMTYSSCPHVGTKISKGKHKIILLQGCVKRSKEDLYSTSRLESCFSGFSLTFTSNTNKNPSCYQETPISLFFFSISKWVELKKKNKNHQIHQVEHLTGG